MWAMSSRGNDGTSGETVREAKEEKEMKLFEEFSKESTTQMFMPNAIGGLITITRRASLQAELNRILVQIAENKPSIDLGGAVLKVQPSITVRVSRLSEWAFNPPLQVEVDVKGWKLNAEIQNVNLTIHDGRPAVEFITESTLQPNIRFVFDDSPERPDESEEIAVTFNRLRLDAIHQAGVPAAKAVEIDGLLTKVQSQESFGIAVRAACGSPKAERRAACRREAKRVLEASQASGAVGSGLIFWLTVGRYLIAAIEWLIWLSQEAETTDFPPLPPRRSN